MKYFGKQFANMTYEVEVKSDHTILTVFLDGEAVHQKVFTDQTHTNMLEISKNEILMTFRSNPMPVLDTGDYL